MYLFLTTIQQIPAVYYLLGNITKWKRILLDIIIYIILLFHPYFFFLLLLFPFSLLRTFPFLSCFTAHRIFITSSFSSFSIFISFYFSIFFFFSTFPLSSFLILFLLLFFFFFFVALSSIPCKQFVFFLFLLSPLSSSFSSCLSPH